MDCFGCVSTEEVVIEVPEEMMAEAESVNCGELDVTSITGGIPDYTITIGVLPGATDALFTAGPSPDASVTPEFMDLPVGDYYIVITDSKGCTFELGPITVESCCDDFGVGITGCGNFVDNFIVDGNYPDGTVAPLPEVFVYCEGDLGCLDAVPMGGNAPYMYEWYELTDNCDYSGQPVGTDSNLPDLQTGTYMVVVTDASGCVAMFEAKIFIDEDPEITLNNDGDQEVTICQGDEFIIEATALQGPDFCKEYCGGELPQCPIDANSIITVCMEFDHTYISDLSFELVAPDGTIIPLVMGQCCPNGDNDADQFCFTNDTSGGAVALDWNTTGSGGTDLLGIGTGISGTWLPESGAGAFGGLVGVDANGGPWAMIVTDIIGGDSGTFNFFEVTITGASCMTVFTSPAFDAPIPDNQQSFTYETPVLECFAIENIISEYEWTCSDGNGTGVVPSTNNEIEDLTFTGAAPGMYTCTLEVWDLWGCSSTADFIINVPDSITVDATAGECELDITSIIGGTPDYTITIGMMPDASDAIATGTFTDASTMPEFTGLAPGDYYIEIVDADGCSIIIGPFTVEPCEVECDLEAGVEACPNGPAPIDILVGLDGLYPDESIDVLPDIYVFCEPGCVSGVPIGGTAPYMYEWFELSDECGYDENAPIANTQEASGLGTGTYMVTITDDNGCEASYEVKVFEDVTPMLTTTPDTLVCANECLDLEGTSTVGPGICLEYCAGSLPQCLIDENTIFTICPDFESGWISDVGFEIVAPDGTVIPLLQTTGPYEGYPNSGVDVDTLSFCFTNDLSLTCGAGNTTPPAAYPGAPVPLDWTIWQTGTTDLLGTGFGISGCWQPGGNTGGNDVFDVLTGVDANSGSWSVNLIDDVSGVGGFYYGYDIFIENPGGCTFEAIVEVNGVVDDGVDNMPGEPTPPIECMEYENCTASYQWTGDDGFDSGVIPIGNVDNVVEILPPVNICPEIGSTVTYTLTVIDCLGCSSTEEVTITAGEDLLATAESNECGELDITTLSGSPDFTVTIGIMPDASDAIATGTFTDASAVPEFIDLDGGDYYIAITDASGCNTLILGPIAVEDCDGAGGGMMCPDFAVEIFGCGMPIDSFIVDGNYPDGTVAPLPEVFVYCEGDLGCLDAEVMGNGGTPPYVFEWFELTDNCNYNDPPIGTGTNIDMLETGTYLIQVTDSLGCTATFEAKIFIDQDPTINLNNGGDTEVWVCNDGEFNINADALQGPDFCKEYW